VRILSIENMETMLSLFTFVDVAYAVHNDMRSHTGGGLSMGRGLIHSKHRKDSPEEFASGRVQLKYMCMEI